MNDLTQLRNDKRAMRDAAKDAHIALLAFYGLCFVVTWAVYLRPSARRLPGV